MIRTIVVVATLISAVKPHSWLECVDYKATHLEHYKLGDFDPEASIDSFKQDSELIQDSIGHMNTATLK
jgi:hypothetical protein